MTEHPNCRCALTPMTDIPVAPAEPEGWAFLDLDELARNALRTELAQRGIALTVPDDRVDGFLRTCRRDVDAAVTAAALDPRPAWVDLHIGKRVLLEDTNMSR